MRFCYLIAILSIAVAGPPPAAALQQAQQPAQQPAQRTAAFMRPPLSGWLVASFDAPPDQPYAAGHRGLDIAVTHDAHVLAPASGTVSFAGRVAGNLTVSVDHGGDLVTTYSYLDDVHVTSGSSVVTGSSLGKVGNGHGGIHPGFERHLHMSARRSGVYFDPMELFVGKGFHDLIDNA